MYYLFKVFYICRIIIKRKNKMANFKTAMTALKNGYKVEYEGNIMKMQGNLVFDQAGFMCTDYLNLFCKKGTGFKILGK